MCSFDAPPENRALLNRNESATQSSSLKFSCLNSSATTASKLWMACTSVLRSRPRSTVEQAADWLFGLLFACPVACTGEMTKMLLTNNSVATVNLIPQARAFEAILDLLKKNVWGSGRLMLVKTTGDVEVTSVIGRTANRHDHLLGLQKGFQQRGHAIPGDLHPDTQKHKRNDPQHAMRRLG